MSDDDAVGAWTPGSAGPLPDAALLGRVAGRVVGRRDAPEAVLDELDAPDLECLRRAMQAPEGALDAAAAQLCADDLEPLLRLFTRAERLPGWEAGERSPVIPLFRHWRAQVGDDARRALVAWIRANSDNRFLPHGSLQQRLGGRSS